MCHASYDPVLMLRDIEARARVTVAAPHAAAKASAPGWRAALVRWFGLRRLAAEAAR